MRIASTAAKQPEGLAARRWSRRIGCSPLSSAHRPACQAVGEQPPARFQEWAQAAGIRAPKVAQTQFGSLRGYCALEDIPALEPFVTVPRSAALVLTPHQRCPRDVGVPAQFWAAAPWFIRMALLLLRERRRGGASPVAGYVRQLPVSVDLPVRWGQAELEALQYRPAIDEIRVQQRQWWELYDGLARAVQEGAGAVPSWDDYLWAMEAVCSRVFTERYAGPALSDRLALGAAALGAGAAAALWQDLPTQQLLGTLLALPALAVAANWAYDAVLRRLALRMYVMCPVVDGANHLTEVQTLMAYDYVHDSFTVRARSAIPAGEQVFINYGPNDNDSLLMYYGFVERGNPLDGYLLELPPIAGQGPFGGLEAGVAPAAAPAAGGQRVTVLINARGGVQPEGLAALSAAQGGGDRAAWAVVAQACRAELARLPTSIQEDEKLLQGELTARVRLAVEFRLEKKRLLQRGAAEAAARAGLAGAAFPMAALAAAC